ncbi:MAG: hypothetical protein DRN61_04645 [Thaumarchaeota archaeon]|nr:MAG: hypothetical protein DRN61_04645 [Nitrososphaerota archaeon]
MNEKTLKVTISFIIFLFLVFLLSTPTTIALRNLSIIQEKTVISIAGYDVSSTDIITIASLASGSVALGTFITDIIIPQTKRVRRR